MGHRFQVFRPQNAQSHHQNSVNDYSRQDAAEGGGAGKIDAHAVPVLVCGQDSVNAYGDKLPGIATEAESHGGNPPVGISTGNHLYRNVNTKDAFH